MSVPQRGTTNPEELEVAPGCESQTDRRVRLELPISKASGGTMPSVDLNCSSELEERMESAVIPSKMEWNASL